ncbi:nuclear transport factor 2 family protein [Kutzneria buriramensis]|uniref:Ketosteroid isomerase-like protein n=1 Tax=Kutzneria buriramensis TaxID=1045776 RepID=A0A3E0HQD9_9PSEU|nr:nuclear transport factor 2 family protein [Kutzneria buriramensis]REH48628.1 ketosteroid isomerase-like protein [Kutzneria buriramensis]
MALTAQDRIDITDLINLHGHLVDGGAWNRVEDVFRADVAYDLEDFGLGTLHGVAAIREAALALGEANPVGHHVTNIVITEGGENEVRVRSKGIGISAAGTAGSVEYDDIVAQTPEGWRIRYRKVTARRRTGDQPGPREVLERWRQAAIDHSLANLTTLYAVDGIHEFPFTAPGLPAKLEGRAQITAWMTEAWRAPFRYHRFRTLAVHDTGDPNTIVVEQEALGTSEITGDFTLPNLLVLTTRDGQIAHLKDYVDIAAAVAVTGERSTWS